MSLTNNLTMQEGDFGVYFQIVQKTNTADMTVHVLFVEAQSSFEVQTQSNATWTQPPAFTILSNQKLWI